MCSLMGKIRQIQAKKTTRNTSYKILKIFIVLYFIMKLHTALNKYYLLIIKIIINYFKIKQSKIKMVRIRKNNYLQM